MTDAAAGADDAPFGRPTAAELLEAVAETIEGIASAGSPGCADLDGDYDRRTMRVVAHVLRLVHRELELGPGLAEAHRGRLASLGVTDDASFAAFVRATTASTLESLRPILREEAVDRLRIANPGWLDPPPHPNVERLFEPKNERRADGRR